jgi:hypothetical protein
VEASIRSCSSIVRSSKARDLEFDGLEALHFLAGGDRLIVEVLVEPEGRVETGGLPLQAEEREGQGPRLEPGERFDGEVERLHALADQRKRRGRDHLVERLAGRQHPAHQDHHLRLDLRHLPEVQFLDQQVAFLERLVERRAERVVVLAEEVHRAHQVDDRLAARRPPDEIAVLRLRRLGGGRSNGGDDRACQQAADPGPAEAGRHVVGGHRAALVGAGVRLRMNDSISSIVLGTDVVRRRRPVSSSRKASSTRTPMSMYFFTAG